MAHIDLMRFERAIEDFSAVISVEPDNAGAYMAGAYAHTMLGKHGEAVMDYDRLVVLMPDAPSIREERQQALELAETQGG